MKLLVVLTICLFCSLNIFAATSCDLGAEWGNKGSELCTKATNCTSLAFHKPILTADRVFSCERVIYDVNGTDQGGTGTQFDTYNINQKNINLNYFGQ